MIDSNIHQVFPTLIYSTTNVTLAENILPTIKRYLSDVDYVTYAGGYKNTYKKEFGLEIEDDLNEIKTFILNCADDFSKKRGISVANLNMHIFANEMIDGDSHDLHTHANCLYSGVFYLQIPDNSSLILFKDPRIHTRFIAQNVIENNHLNGGFFGINPTKGLFLMWDSWLEHKVPVNKSVQPRIALVFNLYK